MINKLKALILGSIDKMNIATNPFDEFTRSLDTVDSKSLAEKAVIFSADIKQNWMLGNGRFYWSMKPNDLGDAAIWQGMATATFAMLGDRGMVPQLLAGQELIQNVNGDNRLCRGVDLQDGPSAIDPSRKYIYKNGYRFIQQVSESSLIGHLYGLSALLNLNFVEHKEKISEMLDGLCKTIVKDGFILRDSDGTPAKHGDLRPLQYPWQLGTRKPVAVGAVGAMFGLAYCASGSQMHKAAYEGWTEENLTDICYPETHFLWVHPFYQDILAYMVLSMLIKIESRPELNRPKILTAMKAALARQWEKNKEEGNPFYTFTVQTDLGGVDRRHLMKAEQVLMEFNTDNRLGPTAKAPGEVINSTGPLGVGSFVWGIKSLNGGERFAKQPLPIYKRPSADFFWQRNPYALDEYTHHHHNCLDFLVGYGLGRQAGVLS